jgi:two-component system cell cycle sensor histidine kinase/response regulator CckA
VSTSHSRLPGLRRDAEDFLKRAPEDRLPARQPVDLREALHELQVHEIELRMQNETLREAQIELEESRELYRELFEGAPVPYLVLDPNGRIRAANAAVAGLLGRTKAELTGTPLAAYLQPEHATHFEKHRREIATSDCRCSCELVLLSADGAPHEVRLESVRSDPFAHSWRIAIIDQTEPNQLKRQLEQAARLEALVLRGRSTVAELLDFGRTERDDAALVEPDRVVQDSMPALRSLLSDEIQLDLKLRTSPARVRMNPERLERLLLDFANNARQAMPRGGRFMVETRLISPEQLPTSVRAAIGDQFTVRVGVSDSGTELAIYLPEVKTETAR